jgi:hypothetical protein
MVVKAVSEQGTRLNIRKTTLRDWRREFARHLRAHGVEANATERAVRGISVAPKLDGIYHADKRGESRHDRTRVERVAGQLLRGQLRVEEGKARLAETRREVERGWLAVSDILVAEGRAELAAQVSWFSAQMPPPLTDLESIAEKLRARTREARPRNAPVR